MTFMKSTVVGVSKTRGTPKWMVYFMENPIKMDDLGVPLFLETPICVCFGCGLLEARVVHECFFFFSESPNEIVRILVLTGILKRGPHCILIFFAILIATSTINSYFFLCSCGVIHR